MYEPLSAEESRTLVRYLKTLLESLDNVVDLLHKRQAGAASLLDLATAAQKDVHAMYKELVNADKEQPGREASKYLLVISKRAGGQNSHATAFSAHGEAS